MYRVLLLGAGKIGRMITRLLSDTGDYQLLVTDTNEAALKRLEGWDRVETRSIDAEDAGELADAMKGCDACISALSFYYNPLVAQTALKCGVSYFDLTEDVATTRRVRECADAAKAGQVFMPQCGLAPGFISIVANHLCSHFDKLDAVRMRVGALSKFPTGQLKYNLTWSTDGLINEYCNPCEAIHDGKPIEVLALEGLEQFSLDGVRYEAFNTSGGLGTLCQTLEGNVRELNYKTIRYMGHRDLAVLLVRELDLGQRREIFKDILEHALPITFQDVVVTFCTVTGWQNGQFVQITDARKIYHQSIDGENWSGIQITTAAGVCAVLDLFTAGKLPSQGFLRQEQVRFEDFMDNRFGKLYVSDISAASNAHNHSLANVNT
ncbi:MAG: saccharopine dehydrogenase [Planctomycetaceae bacterium]|nr:saccharopine dehydrogenase [Planctomycetaceae bacterium]|tara:strand:+ start:161 stop:1297 length:1137 start_codon:yes stop_codon:yes gene_type:complete